MTENCKDGKLCDRSYRFGAVQCRHGLAEKYTEYGTITVCPLEIQEQYEKKQWKVFFDNLPVILHTIRSKIKK